MSISDPTRTKIFDQGTHLSKSDDGDIHLRAAKETQTVDTPPTMSQRSSASSTSNAPKKTKATTTNNDSNSQKNQKPTNHNSKTTNSATTTNEIALANAALARIQSSIPELPYSLSAPVNVEPRYHYPSRQEAESWRHKTPFYPHEEHLQYMTYVYREPGESCFVVKSAVDEEREARAEEERAREARERRVVNGNGSGSVVSTAPGTPVPGSQGVGGGVGGGAGPKEKKKISLGQYKNKKLGIEEASPEKEEPVAQKENMEAKKSVANGVVDREHEEQHNAGMKRSVFIFSYVNDLYSEAEMEEVVVDAESRDYFRRHNWFD